MEWVMVAGLGAVIGLLVGFVASEALQMPIGLVMFIATSGALGGGLIQKVTGTMLLGQWTFYVAGCGFSFMLLAGALFAYQLSREDRPI